MSSDIINKKHINHEFPMCIDNDTHILILGSFPSVLSRKQSFYYMNPTNRFWNVLASIYDENFLSTDILVKKALLKKYHIGLYDVIDSCDIVGSSDASISNVIITDIETIINKYSINKIYLNGKKATSLFEKYFPQLKNISHSLPSTSAANAKYSLNNLIDEWNVIKGT